MSGETEFNVHVELKGQRYDSAAAGLRALSGNLGRNMTGVDNIIKNEMRVFLHSVARDLAHVHGGDWQAGSSGGSVLRRRSGRAVRSILNSVDVRGHGIDNIRGSIGGAGYLAIHETGGTITAKKAQYLTIPLPAALKSNGTPRRARARDWPNTFILKSKKGNLLIVQKQGKSILPLYLLRKSVKIPARLGMRRRLQRDTKRFVDRAMAAAHKRMMQNV